MFIISESVAVAKPITDHDTAKACTARCGLVVAIKRDIIFQWRNKLENAIKRTNISILYVTCLVPIKYIQDTYQFGMHIKFINQKSINIFVAAIFVVVLWSSVSFGSSEIYSFFFFVFVLCDWERTGFRTYLSMQHVLCPRLY